jgi:hypothetical protein
MAMRQDVIDIGLSNKGKPSNCLYLLLIREWGINILRRMPHLPKNL